MLRDNQFKTVIVQARKLGFICQFNAKEKYQITSKHYREKWILYEGENYWLLWLNNTAQIKLSNTEVLTFLERRHQLISRRK